MSASPIIYFSQFKKFPDLVHGISTRSWGNMALTVNGQPASRQSVFNNRQQLARQLKIKPQNIYEVKQAHSSKIIILDKTGFKNYRSVEADGLITNLPQVFLLIKTADCLPLLFYDPVKQVVAAIHSGWRGTTGKIFLLAVLKMINHFGCQAKDLLVGIGPSISSCCFEGKTMWQTELPEWQPFIFKQNNQFHVDQPAFVKQQLIEGGIEPKKISIIDECTSCMPQWFSHRAALAGNQSKNGRFASIIGIKHGIR
ncbi:peptidoglycan editing factor PgeF [Patescibacteria group bacterium]|nr:peptidoglycan editing factor PgeF [Patescibacteria group bacterium]MBU1931665.1 peptidoglycan editing factor PgeF [Patescibacteria group bacterium]